MDWSNLDDNGLKLDSKLNDLGFESSVADPCVYSCKKGGYKIHIFVYVDDLIIASSNDKSLEDFKGKLMTDFRMKDLEILNTVEALNSHSETVS